MRTDAITEAARGTDAIERVFREEGERLWRALLAFTGGRRSVAEEAIAEAFARALHRRDEIRDPARWVYVVAIRVAVDEIRREDRYSREPFDRAIDEPDFSGEVWRALRALSPNQRLAVVLHYEIGFPVDEVADRMGIAAPTVRVHLLRARRRLRDMLGGEDE